MLLQHGLDLIVHDCTIKKAYVNKIWTFGSNNVHTTIIQC
jgi:hypothetical protein